MIFKEAMRSLRHSMSKAVFFALTFYMTTTLLYVYFNMAYTASAAKPEIYYNTTKLADLIQLMEKGNMGNLLMVFVVIMCAIDLFYCNDFFVKNKARELAVHMICGATYIQMAMYLLIQTVLLMAVSIPLGMLTGQGLLALMNSLLLSYGESMVITVSSYAMMEFFAVMLFVVFWITLLNCSFAYKSGAVLLAGGNISAMNNKNSYGMMGKKGVQWLLNILAVFLAVLPLYNFFSGSGGFAMNMIIGSIGLSRVFSSIVLPLLTKLNRKSSLKSNIRLTALGFLRRDLMYSFTTVNLFLCDLLILVSMLFGRENTRLEYLMILFSYLCIAVMQSMTIMFRLETDLSGRKQEYSILAKIGTSEKDRTKIVRSELRHYYVIVLCLALVYGGTALFVLYTNKIISTVQILFLSAAAILPIVLVWILSLIYYLQTVRKPEEK